MGIVVILARDYFFAPNTFKKSVAGVSPTLDPTPTLIPEKNDPEVACDHKYFNFQKGTSWRYKLETDIDIQSDSAHSAETDQYFFTNKVMQTTSSTAVIETIFDNDDEKIITTLTCHKSGIYGFPFPLLGPELKTEKIDKSKELFKIVKPSQTMLFLPPSADFTKGKVWQNILSLDTGLPLFSRVDIVIKNKITDQKNDTVEVLSAIEDISIPIDMIEFPFENLFKFSLVENTGIRNFDLNLDLKNIGRVESKIELVDFKPSPPTSSE